MKRLFILLPPLLLVFLSVSSCSKPKPKPLTYWRAELSYPAGNTVTVMPVDMRIGVKSKISSGQRKKLWKASIKTAEALQKVIPSYLASKNYRTDNLLYWSGSYVNKSMKTAGILSPQEYARLFYSVSKYAYLMQDKYKNVLISPDVTKKLDSVSDYTFYTASWSVVKKDSHKKLKKALKIGAFILIVAVIVVAIVAIAAGGGDPGKGAGDLFEGIFKGMFEAAKHIPVKAILKSTAKIAAKTARVSGRVITETLNNGWVSFDVNSTYVQPVDVVYVKEAEVQPGTQPSQMNPQPSVYDNVYLGIRNGVSFLLPPKDMKRGYILSFVMIHNKTAKVVWSARIFVPKGVKIKKFNNLIKKTFESLPKAIVQAR